MSELEKTLALAKTLPDVNEARTNPELVTPEVVATLNQVSEGIAKIGQVFTDWINSFMPPFIEKVAEIASKVNAVFYQAYLDDGAKYGETHEGMLRWMEERSTESAARAEIERAKQRERDREEMRALGREMARKMAEKGMTREEWYRRMYGFPLKN